MVLVTDSSIVCCRSPLDRWRRAVRHIIRQRAMRSQWQCVLYEAKQHRAELVWNLIREFSALSDLPRAEWLRLCAFAMIHTFANGTIIFSRDNDLPDRFYVVLSGSVAIQHIEPASSPMPMISPFSDMCAPTRTTVQTMTAEDGFGEFELLDGSATRLVTAVVTSAKTRLLIVPREVFLGHWPHKQQLETKVRLVKRSFGTVQQLENAQLCSLYYSMRERCFARNEGTARSCAL